MNQIVVSGRVSKEITTKGKTGIFTLANDREYPFNKDQNGNKISNYFNIKILGEKNILNVQKYLTRGTAIIVTGHYFRDSWKAGNEYKEFNYILCEKWEFQIGKANDNESTPVNIPEVPATNQETTHTPEEPAPEPQEEQGGFMNIPEGIDDDLMDLPFRG